MILEKIKVNFLTELNKDMNKSDQNKILIRDISTYPLCGSSQVVF